MLITIEGIDRAGKTTQIELLAKYAAENHKDWVFTRNPGGTDLGHKLRNILLDTNEIISDKAELMIYLADRAQHVEHFIKPKLKENKTIICDRFTDSTVAYQGYGRGINPTLIESMNTLVCAGIKPSLTILLTVSEKVAELRSTGIAADRLESENKLFFIRIRNGYHTLAKKDPSRFTVIDTDNLNPAEIHQQIIQHIENKVAEKEANLVGNS